MKRYRHCVSNTAYTCRVQNTERKIVIALMNYGSFKYLYNKIEVLDYLLARLVAVRFGIMKRINII